MADWGRPLSEIMELSMPQFNLLSKMRRHRLIQAERWDLQVASFGIQTKEQGEAIEELLSKLDEIDEGGSVDNSAPPGFSAPSKAYPLLHELTPEQVSSSRSLRRIVRFVTIKEEVSAET